MFHKQNQCHVIDKISKFDQTLSTVYLDLINAVFALLHLQRSLHPHETSSWHVFDAAGSMVHRG
jgi:hypothetical protein